MKQVIQNYKSGELQLCDVPVPATPDNGVLVKNRASVISQGTEKLMINFARKSILGKALERPDLVKKVISKVKSDGLMEAYNLSMSRLDEPEPLGYSSAGRVLEAGNSVTGIENGDRVACFGSGVASHAEVVSVPENLFVKVPDGVSFPEASFVGVGAIALHAVRLTQSNLGDRVAVIGEGLLGLIASQLLLSSGCEVFGIEPNSSRRELAEHLGVQDTMAPDGDVATRSKSFTNGNGFDSVLIFASTDSNQPLEQASNIARDRARLVIPGMVGLEIPRKVFYEKELDLIVPRSAGPGIYDENYEQNGEDYPISYVRWTENRNMREFLRQLEKQNVELDPLITHYHGIDSVLEAYERVLGDSSNLGVVLEYPENSNQLEENRKVILNDQRNSITKDTVNVGVIGAGQYAGDTLLPALDSAKSNKNLVGVATASGHSGQHTGDKFGFNYCTTDYEEILQDESIDLIFVLTQHHLHAPMVQEALNVGKSVFVEKPLAIDMDGLKKIVESYNESSGQVLVGFNRRFSPFSQKAKSLMGERTRLQGHITVNAGEVESDSWILDPDRGGGRIIGEVCHFVDLFQYFSESLPERVYAESLNGEGLDATSNVQISLKMENGSTASILYTAQGDESYPRENVRIFSEKSVVEIKNFQKMNFTVDNSTQTKRNYFSIDRGHEAEMEALLNAVSSGNSFPVDFEHHLGTTLATFAVEKSLRSNQPESLDWDKLQ